MAITLNGTTGISSPGGDTSTSLATTNLSYTGTLTGGTGVIAIGTNQIYKDSSGNLGLGVVPSAWTSGYSAIQLSTSGAAIFGRTAANTIYVGSNTYRSASSFNYVTSTAATLYEGENGVHYWFNAPSGTAGNAITFTQAMTLDASGRLGIGTTSPSGRLHLANAAASAEVSLYISSTNSNSTSNNYVFGCGVTADNELVVRDTVNSRNIWQYDRANDLQRWYTAGTERARIDSSGNLLVGTTSGSGGGERCYLVGTGSRVLTAQNNTNTSGYSGISVQLGGGNCNNTSTYHFTGSTPGINQWFLYGNGTSSYSSDERQKKDIETTRDGYLKDISKLRVVKYRWINQDESFPKELGLIAQEVEQVFPGLVQDHELEGVEGTRKVIKHSVMEFIMLKAIQELTTRLEALESKK